MRRSFVSLCATAVASLVLSSAAVRADNIPWGYNAASTSIDNNVGGVKTSSISFDGAIGGATGDSGIIIYNMKTSSTAPDDALDGFNNVPFGLSVTLTDIKSTGSVDAGKVVSGAVNFAGQFNATNVTKASLLPGATNWTSPTTAEVTLGSADTGWRKYTVDISSFTPPGQPGGAPGSIQAIVRISPGSPPDGGGDPPPNPTPEPASLVLAGLGLPLMLLARRRMKKQAEAAAL